MEGNYISGSYVDLKTFDSINRINDRQYNINNFNKTNF